MSLFRQPEDARLEDKLGITGTHGDKVTSCLQKQNKLLGSMGIPDCQIRPSLGRWAIDYLKKAQAIYTK